MTEEQMREIAEDEAMIAEKPGQEEEDGGDVNESKSDKFKRLATMRMNNALKYISNIGKLASPAYEYTDEQVEKMFEALRTSVDDAYNKFKKTTKENNTFSF